MALRRTGWLVLSCVEVGKTEGQKWLQMCYRGNTNQIAKCHASSYICKFKTCELSGQELEGVENCRKGSVV